MKKLILGLLMTPSMAWAVSFSLTNNNGGEIVITDRTCTFKGETFSGLNQAYSYWNGGYIEGCWAIEDGMVKIVWNTTGGPSKRVYKLTDFSKKSDK